MLVSLGGLHTGLCKFVQNISTNIWSLGKRADLKLWEVSHSIISYNIIISWLYTLNGFGRSFLDLYSTRQVLKTISNNMPSEYKQVSVHYLDGATWSNAVLLSQPCNMLGKHDMGSPVTQACSGNVICIKQSEFSNSKSKMTHFILESLG